jgi:UDP-glucose 4-epimerase
MKKVVVTGGAGFIGSHLAEELVRRGYDVLIMDDLSTGKRENIVPLLSPITHHPSPVTRFVEGSITDLPLLQKLFQGVDYVFHQAAIPSVPRSIENPQASHEANITGTLNVLIAARDNSVKKVIYASSSSVYGDTPTLPKKEDMSPNPQSPYAVTKLCGEYYCRVFSDVYGFPTVCLRYFNVYGPRQDPNSQYAAVVPRFIKRVSEESPPIIFGDGEQTRDFTFISDVVEANILAAESDAKGVFNIGGGERRITINALARLVTNIMGKNVEPIHEEPRPGDIKHSLADISRARAFGYEPKYNLEEGLKETVKGFRQCLG